MGRKTLDKGEIAHHEQFLLFPQCFQKACFPGVSKGVILWEWVNHSAHSSDSYTCESERFENIMAKGEKAGNQHFVFFSNCLQKPSFSGSLTVGIVW